MIVDEQQVIKWRDSAREITPEERREQEAIVRAFHAAREGSAPGTVIGYMGKFGTFWQFRDWSRVHRQGSLDLFLLDTPEEQRTVVWLDYIAYLVDVLHIRGHSFAEHLCATKKVLTRNGILCLAFADDSIPSIKEAKLKSKYSLVELREKADSASLNQKLPMFDELEDLMYRKMWTETEDILIREKLIKRGTWIGGSLMCMTGARESNITRTSSSDHTIRAGSVRLMLMRDGEPHSEIYIEGGEPWPADYSENDGMGVEVVYLSQKTGQILGRKVIPAVDTRSIRLVNGIAWWFKFSGVKKDDPLLTCYRRALRRKGCVIEAKSIRGCDVSVMIAEMAYRLGFEMRHFSSKSCRIGLVTGAGWLCGMNWEDPLAQETARMGGWKDASQAGAMRRHYDLSKTVYRKIHPDLALKHMDVWEMLSYKERSEQPRPGPEDIGQAVRSPPKRDHCHSKKKVKKG